MIIIDPGHGGMDFGGGTNIYFKEKDKNLDISLYQYNRFKELGIPCFEPFGAFYVFPNISKFGMTSEEFAMKLLEKEKVAVVPGTAFGDCGEGFLRISYAYSLDNLKVALNRMAHFVDRLRQEQKK